MRKLVLTVAVVVLVFAPAGLKIVKPHPGMIGDYKRAT